MVCVKVEGSLSRLRTEANLEQLRFRLANEVRLHPGEVSGVRLKCVNIGLRKFVAELYGRHADVRAHVEDCPDLQVRKSAPDIANEVVADAFHPAALEVS